MKEEFRILSTTAILGYGFPKESFDEGMKRKPDLIAVDAGSTDPGPFYLGEGVSFTDRGAVKRDLEIMICAGVKENIPVVIGTAGGSGAKPHLEWCADIIREIAKEHDLHFKMAMIHADMDKEEMKKALTEGKLSPLEPAPQLTVEDIDATTNIVGQMGIEPIMKALDSGVQVVLAGRAYDPTVFAAPAIRKGYDKGLAIHLGKILECASICAVPGSGSDCMFGYLGEDYFRVEPLSSVRKCTTLSVAAHTLYEKTNPYILPGPGGHLDLAETTFEQDSENTVKVKGTRYVTAPKYTIKLEGAKCIGYRTVSVAGTRDPIMISKIDDIVEGVRARVADNYRDKGYKYNLNFTIYGKNGVMGDLEPVKDAHPHELGIVIEVVADTQEQADTICASARSTMLHYGYEGRRATAGNLAFPFSPSDFHAGRVYVFSMYHIIEVEDPTSLFPIDIVTL
ncbi:MAG: acyclic terpene utilization AtuA family protein [Oscillospiraceae bacterium]|nr:acyclic terpene utilization AtuA family protein [Oscillospiraceae bacterium]